MGSECGSFNVKELLVASEFCIEGLKQSLLAPKKTNI